MSLINVYLIFIKKNTQLFFFSSFCSSFQVLGFKSYSRKVSLDKYLVFLFYVYKFGLLAKDSRHDQWFLIVYILLTKNVSS